MAFVRKKTDKTQRNKGFSLVQVSMILVVSGILLAAMLPGQSNEASDLQRAKTTQERMEAIEKATQLFMAKNMRRPCPANGDAALNSSGFGTEAGSGGDCSSTAVFNDSATQIVVGSVPTKALGLPVEYALDGWGRRIMYFVDKRVTTATRSTGTVAESCQDFSMSGKKGNLELADDYQNSSVQDKAMWALVSYGKDGHGAFPANGADMASRIFIDRVANNDENSQYNALADFGKSGGVAIQGNRLVRKSPTTTFDDIVWTSESTKNTCCVGKACTYGLRLNGAGNNLDLTNNAVATTTANTISCTSSGTSTTTCAPLGMSIAKGDINGDGVQDLVIGQSTYNTDDGRIYVVFGKRSGWHTISNSLSLDSFDGTNGGVIFTNSTCAAAYISYLGKTIAVGDVDGDGIDDVISMSPARVAVFYGQSSYSGNVDVSTLKGDTTGFTINNATPATRAGGGSVAVGDINGDSVKDILFTGTGTSAATMWAVFGRTKTNWLSIAPQTSQANCSNINISTWTLASATPWTSANALRFAGSSGVPCSLASNYTGTGSPVTFSSGSFPGKWAIGLTVSGTGLAGGTTINVVNSAARTLELSIGASSAPTGVTISGAGLTATTYNINNTYHSIASTDVNKDGYEDIIIGNTTGGLVHLFMGRSSDTASYTSLGTSRTAASATDPTWDESVNYNSGSPIGPYVCAYADMYRNFTTPSGYNKALILNSGAGSGKLVRGEDIDNDGYGDILVASNTALMVYKGRPFSAGNWQTTPPATLSLTSSAVYSYNFSTSNSMTGINGVTFLPLALSFGDLNGDNRTDLLMGSFASTVNSGAMTGTLFGVFQPSTGWTTGSATTLFGTDSTANFFNSTTGLPLTSAKGVRIDGPASASYTYQSAIGDFDGDGKNDVAIASPGDNSNAGRVYIIWGGRKDSWSTSVPERLSLIQ